MWITESYSVRQLCKLSGHSRAKLQRINQYWLNQDPPQGSSDLSQNKYLIYDGTYFHKNGCLICLMDACSQKIISTVYADREGFKSAYPWFEDLKRRRLYPDGITMDGEISVLRAIRNIWPKTKVQRCQYHIQREGLRWLRTRPKTEAGQELKKLLSNLCHIKCFKEQKIFIKNFWQWLKTHETFV